MSDTVSGSLMACSFFKARMADSVVANEAKAMKNRGEHKELLTRHCDEAMGAVFINIIALVHVCMLQGNSRRTAKDSEGELAGFITSFEVTSNARRDSSWVAVVYRCPRNTRLEVRICR